MILFEKVRWKNFLSTGNQYSEIDFQGSPTTLIVGANGSGKSTGFRCTYIRFIRKAIS